MKLTIVLKKLDADGLGGQILEAMGMKRSAYEPEVFVVQHVQDPRLVAPVDVLESMWPVMYVEALMDEGIRPLRVFQKTDSTVGLTPLFASSGLPAPAVVADMLEAAADALEGAEVDEPMAAAVDALAGLAEIMEAEADGVCSCAPGGEVSGEGTCSACGLPMAAAEPDPVDEVIETAPLNAGAGVTDGMKVKAVGVFAKGLEDGEVYTLKTGKDFQGEKTFQFMTKNGKVAARFGESDIQRFLRNGERGDNNGLVKASKGVIDKKTWKMIREKANDALEKAGFDGNGRFKTIGQANSKLADVLSNFGLQLGNVMSADLFREESRTHNFDLEFVNPQDSFSPLAFDDSMVHYSYAKLSPDRVEVVAYLS